MANSLFSSVLTPKRRVFISYHHRGDRYYYNEFSRVFADYYEAIQDNSIDREIDSDDADYVIRTIREDYITGTSCTIVLCGTQTPWRKFVDWEIKATLDKEHGLIGVNLPSNRQNFNGLVTVPDRLHENIQSGYAVWLQWSDLGEEADFLSRQIEVANSKPASIINNSGELRSRNG